jgi:hypothetical protein
MINDAIKYEDDYCYIQFECPDMPHCNYENSLKTSEREVYGLARECRMLANSDSVQAFLTSRQQ